MDIYLTLTEEETAATIAAINHYLAIANERQYYLLHEPLKTAVKELTYQFNNQLKFKHNDYKNKEDRQTDQK